MASEPAPDVVENSPASRATSLSLERPSHLYIGTQSPKASSILPKWSSFPCSKLWFSPAAEYSRRTSTRRASRTAETAGADFVPDSVTAASISLNRLSTSAGQSSREFCNDNWMASSAILFSSASRAAILLSNSHGSGSFSNFLANVSSAVYG